MFRYVWFLALVSISLPAGAGEPEVLSPVLVVPLPEEAGHPRDVTWLDDEVILAAATGGVYRFRIDRENPEIFVPEGPLPDGSPDPELIDADSSTVFIMGGGRRNYLQTDFSGDPQFSFLGGALVPRGLAVGDGFAFMLGWMAGKPKQSEISGALWKVPLGSPLAGIKKIHSIESSKYAIRQFRTTGFPYAGSVVAEPGGTISVMTTVEPGIFRYTADGKLVEIVAPDLAYLVDHLALAARYARDVPGRYRELINRGPFLEDLVTTPFGLAALVRSVEGNDVVWSLRFAEGERVGDEIELASRANGPFGHMRCESKKRKLACLASFPNEKEAKTPADHGNQPKILLFEL